MTQSEQNVSRPKITQVSDAFVAGSRQDSTVSGSIRAWMLGSATMSTDTLFAQWLREEMVKRGYPLEGPRAGGITRLAVDAGISQATMSRTVRGQQEPSIDTLRKLGDLFGLELVQMMAFAGLAEYTQVGASAEDAERGGPFEVIDGEGDVDTAPPPPTREEFWAALDRGEVPAVLPGGFRNTHEQKFWQDWIARHQEGGSFYDLKEVARAMERLRDLEDETSARIARNRDPRRHNPRREA